MLLSTKKKLPDYSAAIDLEPIQSDPAYAAALAELEQRLAETEKRRARAVARLRGAKSPRNPLDRAKELLAGGQIGAAEC